MDNVLLFGLLAVTFAVYATGFSGELVVDDTFILKDNPYLAGNKLSHFFTSGFWENTTYQGDSAAMYRPLVLVYFWMMHKLWGASPHAYHVTLVLLHLANTFLVYLMVRKLLPASIMAAVVGAAVFALHPSRVESMAWISGVPDPMALFFLLAALLAHRAFLEGLGNWRYLALAVACYQCALWSKEVAVAFPLVIAVHDWVYRRRIDWRVMGLYGFLALAYLVVRGLALGKTGDVANIILSAESLSRAMDLVVGYSGWLVFPLQVPLYLQPPQHQVSSLLGWCAAFIVVAVSVAAWRLSDSDGRRSWALSLGWGVVFSWTAILMMFYLEGFYSARFLYVPGAGMAAMAALCYDQAVRWRPALRRGVLVFCMLLAAAYAGISLREISMWRDDVTVYRRITQTSPDGTVGFMNLGYALMDKGDNPGAEENFRGALKNAKLPEVRAEALVALGTMAAMGNDLDQGEKYLGEAARVDPKSSPAWTGLGNLAWMRGRLYDAIPLYEKALAINPGNREAAANLANVYGQTGRKP